MSVTTESSTGTVAEEIEGVGLALDRIADALESIAVHIGAMNPDLSEFITDAPIKVRPYQRDGKGK
jgi:hypothetical protein